MADSDLAERVARLERLMVKLSWALAREGTEADGNWGYKPYGTILREIVQEYPHIRDS